ncbi:testis-specific serine/threonine-protein kinase 6-like [Salminus brasiliensis]|uniref:testis-specific serine/threonine-protein kinase 6-like n=1 Tax=Salminus brasiliensis TaxID=930266 RepID=UPI003B83751D
MTLSNSEMSETADPPVAGTSPQEDMFGASEKQHSADVDGEMEGLEKNILSTSSGLFSSLLNTYDKIIIKHLGEPNRDKMTTDGVLRSLGYEVVCNIGHGAFGQVKLATSGGHPNKVAIKMMDRRLMSPNIVSKFLPRELTILKTVRHPHIVEVHDILEMENGQVFIVMEAAATNLYSKIQELHHIPMDQAKIWFSQLLSAVVYLHQQDIVHRDLKCENVLLTADNQIKLTDFGFGRVSKGFPDLSETYCCTRCYAAPEVIRCKAYDAKKADVWNLGVVLYFMVTGSSPFIQTYENIYPRFQHKAVEYPAGIRVEEDCRSIISSMLRYDPLTRPSVTELQWHPWLQSSPDCKMSETADSLEAETEGSPEKQTENFQLQQHTADGDREVEELAEIGPPTFSGLLSSKTGADEQIVIKHLEKIRVIGRFVVTVIDEDGGSSSHRELNPLQEEDISRAEASIPFQSVEAVGEECGCFSPLCAAVKRAAKAYVAAPFIRASRSLRRRMKTFFVSAVRNSSSDSQ